MKQLVKEDFLEGGIFHRTIFSTNLPIPQEVMDYLYDTNECVFDVDISCKLGLLICIWKLKGVKLFRCGCKYTNHLVSEEEYDDQLETIKNFKKEDFQPNGLFYDIHLQSKLPINSDLIHYKFKDFSGYTGIPENTCFKSKKYEIRLLKQMCDFKFNKEFPIHICPKCENHLNFYN